MHDLLTTARRFPQTVNDDPERFALLSAPQQPEVLLVTCSDSRVLPETLLGAGPGRVFEVRNAGAVVPRHAPGRAGGEQAAVEYALRVLGVREIVVMGHSGCGAVGALVGRQVPPVRVPEVRSWLEPLTVPRDDDGPEGEGAPPLAVAVQEHVVHQLDALRTHPAVAEGLGSGLRVQGWFLDLTSGRVTRYKPTADGGRGGFVAL